MSSRPHTPHATDKIDITQLESTHPTSLRGACSKKHGDEALAILGDNIKPVEISEEDDRKVLRYDRLESNATKFNILFIKEG